MLAAGRAQRQRGAVAADLIQREGVLEEGLNFLPKPSTPQELPRKVREVLDR